MVVGYVFKAVSFLKEHFRNAFVKCQQNKLWLSTGNLTLKDLKETWGSLQSM
jgi:hypothetical protein